MEKYRIKKVFANYSVGDVAQFDVADAVKFKNYIEKVGVVSDKKGIAKGLKSLLLAFGFVAMFGVVAVAGDLTSAPVTISTYPITEVATMEADIDGLIDVELLQLSVSTASNLISIYELCDSTTTVTLWKIIYMSSDTQMSFDYLGNSASRQIIEDICFRKSDTSAAYANLDYK